MSNPFTNTFLALALTLAASGCATTLPPVPPLDAPTAESYDLDPAFFKKSLAVQGILIATSDRVSDHAIRESAYLFDKLMSTIDPDVAQRIRDRELLCILIAHDEFTSDIPQFHTDKLGKALGFYNWRSRGFLTWRKKRPVVVFAEEDVLEYEGGARTESILIHEFGHVIHGAGFNADQQAQLTKAYKTAKTVGLWNDGYAAQRFRRVTSDTPVSLYDAIVAAFPNESPALIRKCLDAGDVIVNGEPTHAAVKVTGDDDVRIVFGGPKECYAAKNRSEYFAEVLQCWYDTNRLNDHDHNHILTRDQLKAYDPGAAELCAQVLGDHAWRFVSPRQRAGRDHLAGFDPADSPVRTNPPHIRAAALDYYDTYWKPFWQRLYDKHGIERPKPAAK